MTGFPWIFLTFIPTLATAVIHAVKQVEDQAQYQRCLSFTFVSYMAGAVAFLRFIFFHLLQPVAYIFVLWLYSDVISNLQLIFGGGVAVRECIYLLATLCVRPSFLLVNISTVSLAILYHA